MALSRGCLWGSGGGWSGPILGGFRGCVRFGGPIGVGRVTFYGGMGVPVLGGALLEYQGCTVGAQSHELPTGGPT